MKEANLGANNEISNETKEYAHYVCPICKAYKNREGLFVSKDRQIEKLDSSKALELQDTIFCHHHQLAIKSPKMKQAY